MSDLTKQDLLKMEENLGIMIQKGFDENTAEHRQFFERFEKIDGRFEKMDERFEKMDGRFENVNSRLDVIEQDIKEIKEEMAPKYKMEDLEIRVKLLERKRGIIS